MKKLLFVVLISLFLLPVVNAETGFSTYSIMKRDFIPVSELAQTQRDAITGTYICNDFESFYKITKNKEIFDTLYTEIFNYYQNYMIDYPNDDEYYFSVLITVDDTETFKINSLYLKISTNRTSFINYYNLGTYYTVESGGNYFNPLSTIDDFITYSPFSLGSLKFFPTFLFLTNKDTTITGISDVIELYDSNGNLLSSYTSGDKYPVLYSSFDIKSNYTEVNLDNYEYVILNLKDYSSNEAFETKLQVKGSIAITPVYEFGTIEKEYITDLCNTSYSDFTDYRFFVLKNDLINNAVYIVKNCQESSSSFRYDSSIFDITYVTDENVNDPVITFGGVEYHTIPFNKLSNTVNKNEEEGFIPGTSEQFDPFGSIGDYISSFWNSLTTFMGLVVKFFNTLPIEIRAVSITGFTTAITLGIIKFIKS